MGLRDLLTPDNYRDYVLPALGVTEAIATRGRSPGTAAQGQMTAFDKEKDDKYTKGRQAMLDAQTAAKDALQNRLGGLQIQDSQNRTTRDNEQRAKVSALQKALELRNSDPGVAANDDQLKNLYYGAYPEKYGDLLKPESNVYLPGANWYYVAPRTGTPSATPLKDNGGNTVAAPPKPDTTTQLIVNSDGTVVPVSKSSGLGPDGKPVTAASGVKAPTEDQSKAANFARRMELAENDLNQLSTSGYDRSTMGNSARAAGPNAANTSEGQRWSNAEKNFATANLRKESGAVIGDNEMKQQEDLYFPRYNDSPETIAQKARNRAQAFAGMKAAAGNQFDKVPSMIESAGTVWRRAKNGKEYEYDAVTKQPTGKSR